SPQVVHLQKQIRLPLRSMIAGPPPPSHDAMPGPLLSSVLTQPPSLGHCEVGGYSLANQMTLRERGPPSQRAPPSSPEIARRAPGYPLDGLLKGEPQSSGQIASLRGQGGRPARTWQHGDRHWSRR